VLLIGDAFTMPEGLPYEDSYGAHLQSALAACLAQRPVQVINAGVTGYGPNEEGPQYHELAPLFRPDVTVYPCTSLSRGTGTRTGTGPRPTPSCDRCVRAA